MPALTVTWMIYTKYLVYQIYLVIFCDVFMERIDLALNLVEERSRLGYSRKNFAEQTGCSAESLRLYESGQVNIPADFLLAAVQLGVDIQFVFTGIHSANLNAVSDDLNKKLDDAIGKSNVENQINGNVSNAVIASSGSIVHQINTQNHVIRTRVDSKPGKEHITLEQASKLQQLVKQVAAAEEIAKRSPKSIRAIWASLNAHCKVPSYKLIALSDYDKAETYLRKWLGRLSNTATSKNNDPDWRKKKYAYIKLNVKQLELEDWLKSYLEKNFSVESLTELSDEDLQKTYAAVSTKKRKK